MVTERGVKGAFVQRHAEVRDYMAPKHRDSSCLALWSCFGPFESPGYPSSLWVL